MQRRGNHETGWPQSAAAWLLALAQPAMAAALVFYLLYQFLLSHVEGDQAYLLYAAQRMLSGVQLDGPQLIETNPPLIVWFSALPAWLGGVLHCGAVQALRVLVLAMLIGSAAWGWRLLRLANVAAALGARQARVLWAATFLLVTAIQPAEFGQREQLLLVLLLPYLLAAGTDVLHRLGMAERAALGMCMGLAVCFKPQHLLTVACLQVYLLIRHRSRRWLLSTELVSAVGVGVAYVAAVRVLTPPYLLVITPLLRSTYWALGEYTFARMLFAVGGGLTLALFLAGAACWLLRGRLRLRPLESALVASALGAALAYFQQHTGWYHQRFPAIALLQIAAVWMAVDLLGRDAGNASRPAGAVRLQRAGWVVLPACALLLFAAVDVRRHRSVVTKDDLQSELAALPAGATVYTFSVGMDSFTTIVEHRLLWGSRFAHLWMLPAIRANEQGDAEPGHPFQALAPERLTYLADLQRSETAEDLQRTQPKVIFVERCAERVCRGYRKPFDTLAWFSEDPSFAKVWRRYRLQKRLPDFDVYRAQQ